MSRVTGLVSIGEVELEFDVRGSGEALLLIPTALTADELVPLASRLAPRYQIISFRRRGYGRSGPAKTPGSIARDAADCRNLLSVLGFESAHVIGASYSGAVALQLAISHPSVVHSLTLIEPPPTQTSHASEFVTANEELVEIYSNRGSTVALDRFLTRLIGPDWRTEIDRLLPGSAQQMESDATTFFTSDIPALLSWSFDATDACKVVQPTLYVGGAESGPWFSAVRELMTGWMTPEEVLVIGGADHGLVLTHTGQVADAIARFIGRHPMPDDGVNGRRPPVALSPPPALP